MTVSNAIKKLSKVGKIERDGHRYQTVKNGYLISFAPNGNDTMDNDIVCCHVQRTSDQADSMSDYFSGSFFDTLTGAIKYANR